jgi:uncharacterized protein YodC (DUF2158 family)
MAKFIEPKFAFNRGQLVRLKSGGPRMTIFNRERETAYSHTIYSCVWFDGGKCEWGNFIEDVLEATE